MPHADTLTVIHHDDTTSRYTDVVYQLHREGIRIWTLDEETLHTDVLMTQAYRAQTPAENASAQ